MINYQIKKDKNLITIYIDGIGEIYGEFVKTFYYYLANNNGVIITRKEYNNLVNNSKKLFFIRVLEINERNRNKGYGKKLLNYMLRYLKKKYKITHVLLNAHPIDTNGLDMPDLKYFYMKRGFKCVCEDSYHCYLLKSFKK